jgi:hypothetical protein
VVRGFAEQNTQLRANHPRLALDNWIYVANGLRGGKVISRKLKAQGPIDISGMDFRFDPLTGKAEAVSGNGQFGLTFDDWGNRFTCSNRNPCMHVVIEDRYLKANPACPCPRSCTTSPPSPKTAASSRSAGLDDVEPARRPVHRSLRSLYLPRRFAAEGVYGNVFTCDPTGNLIHREIMQPAGPTFTSKPAYEAKSSSPRPTSGSGR